MPNVEILTRLILHAVIISSAVVAGMMVSLFCLSAIYLPSPESEVAVYSAVKIKNFSHLITTIAFKILPFGIGLFCFEYLPRHFLQVQFEFGYQVGICYKYAFEIVRDPSQNNTCYLPFEVARTRTKSKIRISVNYKKQTPIKIKVKSL